MTATYVRPFVSTLALRLAGQKPLIQVLNGPRQVGKTTGVRQLMAQGAWPHHYANADDVLVSDRQWLLEHWQQALLLGDGALLVIDSKGGQLARNHQGVVGCTARAFAFVVAGVERLADSGGGDRELGRSV